ncbi:MAG: IS200/IS605 family transposase [Bacteroidales bacterium]
MSQSYVLIYSHFVFHTKYNRPTIRDEIREELYSYIGGILKNLKSTPLKIGGTADHVHILCTLPKTLSVASLMEEVKSSSSKWIKTKGDVYRNFYWQDGYGGFSISRTLVEATKKYIDNQPEHHMKTEFIDEYKTLLNDHGIPFEDRYL